MSSPSLGPRFWNLPREHGVPGLPQLQAPRRPCPARKLLLAKATTSPHIRPVVSPLSLSLQRRLDPLPHPLLSGWAQPYRFQAYTNQGSKRVPTRDCHQTWALTSLHPDLFSLPYLGFEPR